MPIFRKKPVEIEAMRLPNSYDLAECGRVILARQTFLKRLMKQFNIRRIHYASEGLDKDAGVFRERAIRRYILR